MKSIREMCFTRPGVRVAALALGLTLLAPARLEAAVKTWSGAGTTGNWSTSLNWTGGVPPVNGDDVVFQSGAAHLTNTNNLSNLRLNSITFTGSGYTVRGNPLTVTNGISGQQAAGANTFENAVTLGAAQTFDCVTAGASQVLGGNITNAGFTLTNSGSGALTLSGGIIGAGGLTKDGTGVLTFSGSTANTYAGATVVNAGRLDLGKSSYNVSIVGSSLTIGDGVGGAGTAVVRDIVTSQIDSSVPITINSDGQLNLNSLNESIGNSLTLNGGSVDSGSAVLTLAADATITVSGSPSITGYLDIGTGTCTIQGSGYLYLYAAVSGSANIVKNGTVSLYLYGANTFTGSLTANYAGFLFLVNNQALGGTNAGTTLNDATLLYLSSGINITNEALTLNTTTIPAIYVYPTQTNSWSSTNFTLLANATIRVQTNAALDLIGPIGGAGGLIKVGPGTLILSGLSDNTYSGPTVHKEGLLLLAKTATHSIMAGSLFVGDGVGGVHADIVRYTAGNNQILASVPITITNSGWLDLNGHWDDLGPITLSGGDIDSGAAGELQASGDIAVRASSQTAHLNGHVYFYNGLRTITVDHGSALSDLQVPATIRDAGAGFTVVNGVGTGAIVRLMGSNSFTGPLTVRGLTVDAETPWSLGSTNGPTIVGNAGQLFLLMTAITNESLTLGSGTWLEAQSDCTWAGPITLTGDATIMEVLSSGLFDIAGPIGGTGNLTSLTAGGTNRFSGTQANTYVGTTTAGAGTLVLNKSAANGAVPGNLVTSGNLRLAGNEQIADAADVLVNGGGLFDFASYADTFDTLHGLGTVNFGQFGYLTIGANNGTSTFDGTMTGIGYPGGYTVHKTGNGTFTVNGNNNYLNRTDVEGGKLVINGSQPQSPIRVYAGGTLGGSGTVGGMVAAGAISPGASPGMLTCSNVALTYGGTSGSYFVELTGPTAGVDYDQLNVRGTNNLANAILNLNLAFTKPVGVGQQFVIINNDGSDPITAIFAGYPEGSTLVQNGFKVAISYVGGTGNDVVLTLTEVPGASAGCSVSSGNGDGAIQPNECDSLNIALTNQTGMAMTGVTATLSSSSPNVLVTQPVSAYADLPGSGKGTNTTPFQISILPSFVCGNPINLQLAVSSTSHGSFLVPAVLGSGTPSATPVRFNNNTVTNVPDIGAIESTNTVASWSRGAITKVAVSLWLGAPLDDDLDLTLIAPDGTPVVLSSGNGAGANFGTGNADANRTTFDDSAAVSIMAGAPPFVGSFRPEGALASLAGTTANGNWRLRIQDNFAYGSPDTLRAWSLFLYGTTCAAGGGACALCAGGTLLTNTLDATTATLTTRLVLDGISSTCAAPKTCPGASSPGSAYYQACPFYNAASNACVTVSLTSLTDANLMSVAYLGEFTPGNVCLNYLADAGDSTHGAGTRTYSFNVPSNSLFTIVVNDVDSPGPYSLAVSGGDCPPILNIQSLVAPSVEVSWPTVAGGYQLEFCLGLATPAAWGPVSNQPIAASDRFCVTNSANSSACRFYRLHRP